MSSRAGLENAMKTPSTSLMAVSSTKRSEALTRRLMSFFKESIRNNLRIRESLEFRNPTVMILEIKCLLLFLIHPKQRS